MFFSPLEKWVFPGSKPPPIIHISVTSKGRPQQNTAAPSNRYLRSNMEFRRFASAGKTSSPIVGSKVAALFRGLEVRFIFLLTFILYVEYCWVIFLQYTLIAWGSHLPGHTSVQKKNIAVCQTLMIPVRNFYDQSTQFSLPGKIFVTLSKRKGICEGLTMLGWRGRWCEDFLSWFLSGFWE